MTKLLGPTRAALALLALLASGPAALAGSQSFTTPGSYSFTVPSYSTLTVTANGAGGGGGGGWNFYFTYGPQAVEALRGGTGGNGGASSFGALYAGGGTGGTGALMAQNNYYSNTWYGSAGSTGSASGGDSNTPGGGAAGGVGGLSNCGGSTAADGNNDICTAGNLWGWPYTDHTTRFGGNGGPGGSATKTYQAGELGAGSVVTVVVGGGGAKGMDSMVAAYYDGGPYTPTPNPNYGAPGGDGSVTISWVDAPPPTPLTPPTASTQTPVAGAVNIGGAGPGAGKGGGLAGGSFTANDVGFDWAAYCNGAGPDGQPRSPLWIASCLQGTQ